MGTEIERKFLVIGDDWRSAPAKFFSQAYLVSDQSRTVRVRIVGEQSWLTVKGPSLGATRSEFEYAIPVEDAQHLLELCEDAPIIKNRYQLEYEGMTWEVDEFLGKNKGLVVAEVELTSEDQVFIQPDWVGAEVTEDPRYFNSNLSKFPFQDWGIGE